MNLDILKARLKGSQFKKMLKKKNVSKYRLAKDLNISQRTLYYWQRETIEPSDELAVKVGRYLGLIGDRETEKLELKKELKALGERIQRLE